MREMLVTSAARRLLEQPAGPTQAGRTVQSFGYGVETGSAAQKRSMNPGGQLACQP